ncbi:hypothetical protein [Nonomuraea sp. SBT364]|uniref:hypothetical protein n=1 Tax=Nonomuraea sp. SBT364 TaxID=1580530 RepID=UPI00066B41C8|nr:hypothetical protein [Nonomuraea sp. SBT364]
MQVKGISYLAEGVRPEDVRRDLRVIREELHCTAVLVSETGTARHALEAGLDVWVRPAAGSDAVARLAALAAGAEELRLAYPGRVTLLVGNEFSLFTPGMIPGPGVFGRLWTLRRFGRLLGRRISRRLGVMLGEAVAVARREFGGPLSYCAGYWEQVDWTPFDVVGVNLYRSGADPEGYRERVGRLVREAGKPVVITEFGCGAHAGAERRGAGSFLIVNWFTDPPRVRKGHVRDEATQARYLGELIEVYETQGVHGCFVYTFATPDFPRHEDPRLDLDMAGFGIVGTPPGDPAGWTPKAAFHEVAGRYRG